MAGPGSAHTHRGSACVCVCAQTLHSNRGGIIADHCRQRPSDKPGRLFSFIYFFYSEVQGPAPRVRGERAAENRKTEKRKCFPFWAPPNWALPPPCTSLHSPLSLLLPSHAPFVWLFFVSFLCLCAFSFSLPLPFRSVTAAGEMHSESKWNFRRTRGRR